MYIVEIFTHNEVWEVQLETTRRAKALEWWRDCIIDGYNARLTYEKEGGRLGKKP